MPHKILEQIRKAEAVCEERVQKAYRDAGEIIRQAESDHILKLQKAGQDVQMYLRKSAEKYEAEGEKIRCTALREAEEEADILEKAASAKIHEAAAVVTAEILGRSE